MLVEQQDSNARTQSRGYDIRALTWQEAERDHELLDAWEKRLQHAASALLSSPEWVDHLVTSGGADVLLLVVRDRAGQIAGVLPTARQRLFLRRESRSHGVATSKLTVATLLGTLPLLPDDDALLLDVVGRAFEVVRDCDAVYFDALALRSRCFRLFERRAATKARFLSYCPYPSRAAHSLELPASFAELLRQKTAKSRYKLRRTIRELDARGAIELVCCRSEAEVDGFLSEAAEVQRRSWQHDAVPELLGNEQQCRRQLQDLARRGLLRSYLLRCGGSACAFVIGFQGRGVFHYWEVGYHAAFAEHSPGTVLLYLLLEHLFGFDRPKIVDFGKGDDAYKRRFATHAEPVTSLLVLEPTLANTLRVRAHEFFVNGTRLMDLILGDSLRRARLGHGS